MLLINFKTYPQAIGAKALKLAQDLAEISRGYPQVSVGFAPPVLDLAEVAQHTPVPIWIQHVDPTETGKHTGYLSPADAKAVGAYGTFLNHSEHPLDRKVLGETTKLARQEGLKVLIFAHDPKRVAEFRTFSPDFIAYEPPELVGGKVSVTSAKPKVTKDAVQAAKDIPLLVGAGIHGKSDITTALSLGAVGAVVSSAVVTAAQPRKIFGELLSGFKSVPTPGNSEIALRG